MSKIAPIEKCKEWEEGLQKKGFTKHAHPGYPSMDGWFLWVKPGSRSYSILWGDKLEHARESSKSLSIEGQIPTDHSVYWRMDVDLSKHVNDPVVLQSFKDAKTRLAQP